MSHPFGSQTTTQRSLGEQVKAARKAAGLSQAAFAARLGTTQQTVCRWENDANEPDVLRTLGLQMVVDSLVGGTQQIPCGPFSRLSELTDDLGTIVDLLKALDLIGDGIGGETGFAVSAVAQQAKVAADNALHVIERTNEAQS